MNGDEKQKKGGQQKRRHKKNMNPTERGSGKKQNKMCLIPVKIDRYLQIS